MGHERAGAGLQAADAAVASPVTLLTWGQATLLTHRQLGASHHVHLLTAMCSSTRGRSAAMGREGLGEATAASTLDARL